MTSVARPAGAPKEPRIVASGSLARSAVWDEMSWPIPPGDLESTLRYGQPSRGAVLSAASVVAAYVALIRAPARKRQAVLQQLRRAYKSLPAETQP